MFTATTTQVHRTVTVVADLSGDNPPDLRVAFHQKTVIRPDAVRAEFIYSEHMGQWRAGQIKVIGYVVLKSGATGQLRRHTRVAQPEAPWVFQWVDSVLCSLNAYGVPDLPSTLALDLVDLDSES